MRTIRISDEVWQAIAARGKFGETEENVLRRVLGLEKPAQEAESVRATRPGRGDRRFATKRMSSQVSDKQLVVEFDDGARQKWPLPEKTDRESIRKIRDTAA